MRLLLSRRGCHLETAQELGQDWNFIVFGEHTEEQKVKWLWHEKNKKILAFEGTPDEPPGSS